MNRRDFLRRLTVGGIATAAAAREWPFRVFSFPQEIKIASVALPPEVLIRAFDPLQSKMLNRWDVLYGFSTLDEARVGPFLAHPDTFKCATPEDAKLGIMTDREFKAIERSRLEMEKEAEFAFESTAIAPPSRFTRSYELGDPDKLGTSEIFVDPRDPEDS